MKSRLVIIIIHNIHDSLCITFDETLEFHYRGERIHEEREPNILILGFNPIGAGGHNNEPALFP